MTEKPKQPPIFEGIEIGYLMMVVPEYFTKNKEHFTDNGKILHKKVWKKILDYRDFYN